ncbi:AMP-binding protein [Aldersonia sp. NBC_00410]|uniref:AMP-binding protein n=1 Tax=Aldersonia sp. NBC_00410 TaxID=2975954 RepID=UPI00225AA51C|nr:AMP-binding protein [Aldersonia sp. NBC_00410]MCX5046530.1 AMP-binding protein [Aldersonia sp. NBC_00410]
MPTDPQTRVRELLDRYATPQACVAELLCDGHPQDAIAATIVESDLSATDLTYGQLREQSERFAVALAELGVEPGDRVATLMGKSAELIIAVLGIWRRGAVHVPLFTAFAPPAIAFRLTASATKVVVVDADQISKLAAGEDVPDNPGWITVGVGGTTQLQFADLLAGADPADERARAVAVGAEAPIVQLFTSGTTGTPKGVPVPAKALASFHAYLEFGLDVRADDVFWNAADPGWAYGLYYAIIAPLAAGVRTILLHAGFSAPLTWQLIERFGVTNFAAAPTVYRSLSADSTAPPEGIRLRRASSAGEPLTPDVVSWSDATLGVAVRDHYGQTEHGMFIVNAWHDALQPGASAATGNVTGVPPGSMGKPLPGWTCAVLSEQSDDVAEPGTLGRVAIDTTASPLLWFHGYVDAPEKTASRYTDDGRWYLTGDAGSVSEDGFYFFSARDDDVIIMAGYRIGPFDVESVLVMHEAVAEAAVVGMPDQLRGEVLEAFVVLREGVSGDDALIAELQSLVKKKFAAHAYPRQVHFVEELPKTPSGKVQRFRLRQGEG